MIIFPEYALKCLNTLKSNGFDAYFVGGCVRDALLGRKFDDVDITTNALPDDIITIFDHTVPTGIKHGTVTVIIDGKCIEVTTYRTEAGYTDSRHPDSVRFVSDLSEDLSRRDFTINALAFDPSSGLVDIFDGINDLFGKTISAVGEPQVRFKEDALRILRAFRFASVLGFEIEANTKKAIFELSSTVSKVSGERVLTELIKLAYGYVTDDFIEFLNLGALAHFGIYSAISDHDLYRLLKEIKCEPYQKFALFITLTEHETNKIKTKLKPSGTLLNMVEFFDTTGKSDINLSTRQCIKKALYTYSKDNIILYACRMYLYEQNEALRILSEIDDIEKHNEPYRLDQLDIRGDDLIKCGLFGKEIRFALEKALDIVIENPNENQKDILLKKLFE